MAILRYYDSSGIWHEKEFTGDLAIGRAADNDLQLNDPQISDKHLLLQDQPQGMLVTDLGSTNGTWVNGAALKLQTPYRINSGQEIRIGGFVLQIVQAAFTPGAVYNAPQYAQAPAPKKKFPLLAVILGGVALLLCCGVAAVVGIFGGLLALPVGTPVVSQPVSETSVPAQQLPAVVELNSQDETRAAADGTTVTDSQDVALTVAAGSVQGADGVVMTAWAPPDGFDAGLKKYALERKSSLYSLKVDGAGENLGGAQLSFPAASPDDRLAVLVEHRYLAVLGVLPQDGRLVVTASVDFGVNDDASESGANAYFVVSPGTTQGSQLLPSSLGAGFTLLLPAAASYNRQLTQQMAPDCFAYDESGNRPFGAACWNQAKTIFYLADYSINSDANKDGAYRMIAEASKMASGYQKLGIKRVPTPEDPLFIFLDNNAKNPNYNTGSHMISLSFADVSRMDSAEAQQMLAHEMFHWIEHKTYSMSGLLGRGNEPFFIWQMETRAEAASFFLDAGYQTTELFKRGAAFHSDANQVLGWQEAGGDWATEFLGLRGGVDPDRYIHGIMVRMGICTGGENCKGTLEQFVADVNNGTTELFHAAYPKVLPNTALYLLGFTPANADYGSPGVDFSVPELQTGRNYGDYIHVSMAGSEYVGVYSPVNLSKVKETGVATINAVIGKDAIYPLRVSNGADYPVDSDAYKGLRLQPNVPYSLTIGSGVEFYYREGNGELKHSDGSIAMVFEPITSAASVSIEDENGNLVSVPGIPVLRLVAVNSTTESVTLRGTFAPMPPLFSANPDPIKIKDLGTPIKIEVNGERIFPNIKEVTAVIDYKDGSSPVRITESPAADGTIQFTDTHKFLKNDMDSISISFVDIKGSSLDWPALLVAVEGGGATGRPAFNIIGVEILFGNTNYDPNYSYLGKTIVMNGTAFYTTPNQFIQGAVSPDYKTITLVLQVDDHNIQLTDIPLINADNYNKTYQYGVCTAAAILPHVLLDGDTPNWTPEAGSEGRECVMIYLAEAK